MKATPNRQAAYQAAMADAMRAMSLHTKALPEPPPRELVDALSTL